MIECSQFSLYKRYLDGEDVVPVLQQLEDEGFNAVRVWLLNTSVIPGRLEPKNYPQFYEQLRPFVDLCAAYGLMVEFTLFTQAPLLMPREEDQQEHASNVCDALQGANVFLELVNEYDHKTGGQFDNWPKDAKSPILVLHDGMIASKGSAVADAAPMRPSWDYELYHSNDLSQWQRKVGHNAMEFQDSQKVPAFSNENTRPDKDGNTQHHFDAAAGAALLCNGACFHSNSGKLSVPMTGVDLDCARAWVAGAKSVPLEFRTGRYDHAPEEEQGSVLRTYYKILPDGRRFKLDIRA